MLWATAGAIAAIGLWAGGASGAAAADKIDIPEGELTLHAMLYRPAGPGPFPVVVALHDCAGFDAHAAADAEPYGEWTKLLLARGFALVFPDSFGSRGLGSQCRVRPSSARTSRERVADVVATRHWLQAQAFVRPDRISLLGWSSGGIAALWAVRPNATPHDGGADFRSAVALYPGCRRLRETAWSARVPTLILLGGADDASAAALCQQMVAGAHGRSARAEIMLYPSAHHDFDRAEPPPRPRTGGVRTADPPGTGRGVNQTARTDAFKRVPQWLAR